MSKERNKYKFTVDYKGKTYNCERTVIGTKRLNQDIYVNGIGGKSDHARYGPHDHPVSTMEGIAEAIALEIIENQEKKT